MNLLYAVCAFVGIIIIYWLSSESARLSIEKLEISPAAAKSIHTFFLVVFFILYSLLGVIVYLLISQRTPAPQSNLVQQPPVPSESVSPSSTLPLSQPTPQLRTITIDNLSKQQQVKEEASRQKRIIDEHVRQLAEFQIGNTENIPTQDAEMTELIQPTTSTHQERDQHIESTKEIEDKVILPATPKIRIKTKKDPCKELKDSMPQSIRNNLLYAISKPLNNMTVLRDLQGNNYFIIPKAIKGICKEYSVQTSIRGKVLQCSYTECPQKKQNYSPGKFITAKRPKSHPHTPCYG